MLLLLAPWLLVTALAIQTTQMPEVISTTDSNEEYAKDVRIELTRYGLPEIAIQEYLENGFGKREAKVDWENLRYFVWLSKWEHLMNECYADEEKKRQSVREVLNEMTAMIEEVAGVARSIRDEFQDGEITEERAFTMSKKSFNDAYINELGEYSKSIFMNALHHVANKVSQTSGVSKAELEKRAL